MMECKAQLIEIYIDVGDIIEIRRLCPSEFLFNIKIIIEVTEVRMIRYEHKTIVIFELIHKMYLEIEIHQCVYTCQRIAVS